jgi:hypothetical protein
VSESRRVTERDLEVLAFLAEHRLVLAAHVQALLGVGDSVAYRRLAGLAANGLVEHARVLHGQPGWYRITRAGLALIGSELPPPRFDLRCYRHDIGLAWLGIAASRGALGAVDRVVSERSMRSCDGKPEVRSGERAPFGVRLGGAGPGGQTRLHYPDLLLIGPRERRVAIELELSSKGRRRLETILAGYGADPSVSGVLFLADRAVTRREVSSAAARLGISDIVHVQRFAWEAGARPRAAGGAPAARAPAAIGAARGLEREGLAR